MDQSSTMEEEELELAAVVAVVAVVAFVVETAPALVLVEPNTKTVPTDHCYYHH
jgi:hypothetical protein